MKPFSRIPRALSACGLFLLLCTGVGCSDDGPADPIDAAVEPDPDAGGFVDRTTFVDPPVFQPDGNDVYQLRVEPAQITIDGKTLCLRTFNGTVPAPTIRIPAPASANDQRQVRLDFTNALTTEDLQPVGPPGPGATLYDFNETNLHTHGLHVQPNMSSDGLYLADNVLVHHAAGATAEYRFDIDEDLAQRGRPHEPGTFWYHPHVHGTTGIQVANGMAGAIIIEGDVDQLPGIAEARERIFVMTHINVDDAVALPNGRDCSEADFSINDFAIIARAPSSVQVNGVVKPRIVVPPGQVERWRLVHAGVTQEMKLELRESTDADCSDVTGPAMTVHQIAVDGITYHAKDERTNVYLSSGNRADIMVTAPSQEGVYCLAYEQAGGPPGSPAETIVVAILETDSEAGTPTGALPEDADLDNVALPLLDCNAAPDGTQDLIFSQQVDSATGQPCDGVPPGGGLGFNINCREFDHNNPRVLNVNRIEDWNADSEAADHPLHIHVNPFMVCEGSIEGEALPPHWRDTVMIREADGSMRLRMHYETYTGSFVTHCHKLHHEDQGMMELIRIDP